MHKISRRTALALGPVTIAGVAVAKPLGTSAVDPWESYPTTNAPSAQEFVGASHVRHDRVREMLKEDAGLAKASWDWGFGDWETAIGAASHTGQIEIIETLIAHGARPSVFTLATLDRVDALRSVIENIENIDGLEGPHSISLLRHAEAGRAERVIDYLTGLGLTAANPFEIERETADPYIGTYAWSTGEHDKFEVEWFERMSCLMLKRTGSIGRNLIPLGEHAFSPAGARHVRIQFEVAGDRVIRVLVPWAGVTLRGERT